MAARRILRRLQRGLFPEEHEAVKAVIRRHPGFLTAVSADTEFAASRWGRPMGPDPSRWAIFVETLRLAWEGEAYLAQIAFRLQADLRRRGIPILPRLLHQFSIIWAQVLITDTVVIKPGISIPRGQVTIGGLTQIGAGVSISPFVTVGLTSDGGYVGPTIGPGTQIGTGVRILGPITIGARARLGANSVVLNDVPAGKVAVGAPARVLQRDAPV